MSKTVSPKAEARLALEKIDEVLRKKPDKDNYALTEASQKLCIWRDVLIEEARRGGVVECRRLERANGVLSALLAAHFPCGPVPWGELAAARKWLADLLGEVAPKRRGSPSSSVIARRNRFGMDRPDGRARP